MSPHPGRLGQTAIVIGASLGGLLAARTLSAHYERILLLERDTFPQSGQNRKGVPQGPHAHALLARGREVLEQFFPGLTAALVAQGALIPDLGDSVHWFNNGVYHCQYISGLLGLGVSRPALEAEVRARVLALPNVSISENCDVLGLTTDAAQARVTGVHLIRRAAGSAVETLTADLVVDACGRGSRSPAWLEALGYDRPQEEEVRINVGYATRYYRQEPQVQNFIIASTPPGTRGAVLLLQEDNRMVVTLAGFLGDHPPADEAGFLEFARSLPAPEIYHAIREAQPLTDVLRFKYPASLRRRYERLMRFPEGYLVFGDALCSFNPVYGQGMTACALEAETLQACLRSGSEQLAQRFFAQAARVIDIPWRLAVGNDLRRPEVAGPRSAQTRFINWYIGKLHIAAQRDPRVAAAFLSVLNLMAPPASVMGLPIALRVLWGNLGRPQSAA